MGPSRACDLMSGCLGMQVLAYLCLSFPSCKVDVLVSLHCKETAKTRKGTHTANWLLCCSPRPGRSLPRASAGVWTAVTGACMWQSKRSLHEPERKHGGGRDWGSGQASETLGSPSRFCLPSAPSQWTNPITASEQPAQAGPLCGEMLFTSMSRRPAAPPPVSRKHQLCALVILDEADLGGLTGAAAVSWLGDLG